MATKEEVGTIKEIVYYAGIISKLERWLNNENINNCLGRKKPFKAVAIRRWNN